jgi:hypothetical protein
MGKTKVLDNGSNVYSVGELVYRKEELGCLCVTIVSAVS